MLKNYKPNLFYYSEIQKSDSFFRIVHLYFHFILFPVVGFTWTGHYRSVALQSPKYCLLRYYGNNFLIHSNLGLLSEVGSVQAIGV